MGCPCPRHHLCLRWYLAWRNHHSRRPSYPRPTHHKISYHIIVNNLIIIRKERDLTCKSSGWSCLRHRMPRTRTRNTFFQTRLRWSLERSSSHGSTWERILGTYESEKKTRRATLTFFLLIVTCSQCWRCRSMRNQRELHMFYPEDWPVSLSGSPSASQSCRPVRLKQKMTNIKISLLEN